MRVPPASAVGAPGRFIVVCAVLCANQSLRLYHHIVLGTKRRRRYRIESQPAVGIRLDGMHFPGRNEHCRFGVHGDFTFVMSRCNLAGAIDGSERLVRRTMIETRAR